MVERLAETVLVTGATNGTGKVLARRLHQEGYSVILHGRNPEKVAGLALELGDPNLPRLIADYEDPEQVRRNFGELLDSGVVPNRIFHLAAGGMEPYSAGVGMKLARMVRDGGVDSPRFEDQARELVDYCAEVVVANRERTNNINLYSPRVYEDVYLERGLAVEEIDLSSLWSTFWKKVPVFYEGIAHSKGRFERQLGARSFVLSAGVIDDTGVGKIFRRYVVPLGAAETQQDVLSRFVNTDQTVGALIAVSRIPAAERGDYGFLYGPDGNVIKSSTDDEALDLGLPPVLVKELDYGIAA